MDKLHGKSFRKSIISNINDINIKQNKRISIVDPKNINKEN
jgi:hypothetical protein